MATMDVWTANRPPPPTAREEPDGRTTTATRPDDPTGVPVHRHWTHRLFSAFGLVAAVAVTAAFTAMALLPTMGMRTMIVLSGSMEPAFQAGDAVVVQQTDPTDVQVGDMIAFSGYGTDHLTTHRVISLHEVKGELHFRTQGDANPDPDANLAPAGGLHGTVRVVLPHAGRLLATMTGRQGKLVILGLPALLLVAGQLRALLASIRTSSAGSTYRPGAVVAGVAILAVATMTGATLVHTMATFTSAHGAGDNTFSTGTGFDSN